MSATTASSTSSGTATTTNNIIGPLTTIFTPPASCTDVVTIIGTGSRQSTWQGLDTPCYPSGWVNGWVVPWSYYSPGICPYGWTTAEMPEWVTGQNTANQETTAVCCPSGYSAQGYNVTLGTTAVNSVVYSAMCVVYYTTPVTTAVFSTSDPDFTGPLPTDASLVTTVLSNLALDRAVVPVLYKTTDAAIMSLLGSSVGTLTPTSSSSSTSSTASADPATTTSEDFSSTAQGSSTTIAQSTGTAASGATSSSSSSSLSPGAIAGIVIGVIGVIALFFAGWAFLRMQRRKAAGSGSSPEEKANSEPEGEVNSADGVRSEVYWGKTELDGRDAFTELEAPRGVNEVSAGQHHAWEMSAESRPTEMATDSPPRELE